MLLLKFSARRASRLQAITVFSSAIASMNQAFAADARIGAKAVPMLVQSRATALVGPGKPVLRYSRGIAHA
ncbi:MAG: hypothetical protein WBD67_05550 [Terracidiphilus sp.]